MAELIRGGESGTAFEPEAAAIRDAIEEAEDNDLPRRMRRGARRAYETYHNPDRYLESYLALLQEASEKGTLDEGRRDAHGIGPSSYETVSRQG